MKRVNIYLWIILLFAALCISCYMIHRCYILREISLLRQEVKEYFSKSKLSFNKYNTYFPLRTQLLDYPILKNPIDVVITWVDGRDPVFSKQKNYYLKKFTEEEGNYGVNGSTPRRWNNYDEIRQSVKSVKVFLPWVRKIFIVTGFSQRPEWYSERRDDIILVDHKEIFAHNKKHLPVFNSHAIEANLWRINGLSEKFISFNDDMYIGKRLPPTYFFPEEGKMSLFYYKEDLPSGEINKNMGMHEIALINMKNIYDDLYGARERPRLDHIPKPMLKSVCREVWNHPILSYHMDRTSRSKFRSRYDIVPIYFFSLYAFEKEKVHSLKIKSFFTNVVGMESLVNIIKRIKNDDFDMYCMNDGIKDDSEDFLLTYKYVLETKLPHHT